MDSRYKIAAALGFSLACGIWFSQSLGSGLAKSSACPDNSFESKTSIYSVIASPERHAGKCVSILGYIGKKGYGYYLYPTDIAGINQDVASAIFLGHSDEVYILNEGGEKENGSVLTGVYDGQFYYAQGLLTIDPDWLEYGGVAAFKNVEILPAKSK